MKRLFDLILAMILIMVLLVPMLVIMLAIRLTSKGPALYWSDRIGFDNSIYKIGLASIKIKNIDEAIEAFQMIINDYPKSQYANSAYEFILQLEGEK